MIFSLMYHHSCISRCIALSWNICMSFKKWFQKLSSWCAMKGGWDGLVYTVERKRKGGGVVEVMQVQSWHGGVRGTNSLNHSFCPPSHSLTLHHLFLTQSWFAFSTMLFNHRKCWTFASSALPLFFHFGFTLDISTPQFHWCFSLGLYQ